MPKDQQEKQSIPALIPHKVYKYMIYILYVAPPAGIEPASSA